MAKLITALLLVVFAFAFFAQAQHPKTPCPANPSPICPLYLIEMCVYTKTGGSYMIESNPCIACQNTNITATSIGACLPTAGTTLN